MKLPPAQLVAFLNKNPTVSLCVIAGEEPLQQLECQDMLRAHAQKAGFTERHIIEIPTQGTADLWKNATQNRSLWSKKQLIEFRLPPKPSENLQKALAAAVMQKPADQFWLWTIERLDSALQNTTWFKTVESQGLAITIWPMDAAHLPAWIEARLKQAGLKASRDAIDYLVTCGEGNLLALSQAIQHIALLHPSETVSAEQAQACLQDVARFSVFEWMDRALAGDAADVMRILDQLKVSGTEPTLLLWALVRDIRLLLELHHANQQGQPLNASFSKLRIWPKRQSIVKLALTRLPQPKLEQLLCHAHETDKVIKGVQPGNSWVELGRLVGVLTV